jgi:cytochrome c2
LKTLFTLVIFIILSACSDESNADKKIQNMINLVDQGKIIFNKKHLGKDKVIGCVLCHSVKTGQVIIGPSLAGLSIRAPHIVKGETADQYIRNAITNPDAYIVKGFTPAIMLSNYESMLTKDEVDALVAYLMTL